jgi:hypothetical protein
VRILDLVTGQQRSIPSSGAIFVYSITWSPDSGWLVWDGTEGHWGANGFQAGAAIAGRVGPDQDVMASVPRTSAESTRFAVDNDGTVLIATTNRDTLWNGEVLDSTPRRRGWYPVVLTPRDGVLLEAITRSDDPSTYRKAYRKPTPSGPVSAKAITAAQFSSLGLLGPSSVSLLREYGEESDALALIDLDGEVTVRQVGEVLGASRVSVAVDLMTDARPTVDRPDPVWLNQDNGWSGALVAITIGLGLVGFAGLGALVWLLRRRVR